MGKCHNIYKWFSLKIFNMSRDDGAVTRRKFLKISAVTAGSIVAAGIAGGVIGYLSGRITTTREIFKMITSTQVETKTVTTYPMSVKTITQLTTVTHPTTVTITPQKTTTSTITKTVTTIPRPIRARFPFSGVNLVSWPTDYEFSSTKKVIDHLTSLSVNYIMLLLELNQESKESSSLTATYDLEGILKITEYAKMQGMKIGWLPFIIVKDGAWRGEIMPEDPTSWFRSYKDHLISIASKANEADVNLLMLGSELETMTNPNYEEEWFSIIKAIRQRYWGQICYAVNWWYDETSYQRILASRWLRKLDYIGVSAYFELTSKNDPTIEELMNAWMTKGISSDSNIISELKNLYEKFERPIIFTEIGYRSVNGANKQPWNCGTIPSSDNQYDPQEQADCYEALFKTFAGKEWWKGCFIWAYDTSLAPREEDKDYTPLSKPAEKVLHNWYKPST